MRRLRVLSALVSYGGLLIVLRPQGAHLGGLHRLAGDPEHLLVGAAALIGWVVAAWLFLATTLAAAAQAPSALGRLAAGLSRLITPRLARRLLEVSLGMTLAVGPAGAAFAGPALTAAGQPVSAGVPAPIVAAALASFPDLDRPTATPTADATVSPADTPAVTPALTPAVTPLAPAVPAAPVGVEAGRHTVLPGDTLWGLAAQTLPAEAGPGAITALWKHWYAINRVAIGADPNLLLPGELLSLTGTS